MSELQSDSNTLHLTLIDSRGSLRMQKLLLDIPWGALICKSRNGLRTETIDSCSHINQEGIFWWNLKYDKSCGNDLFAFYPFLYDKKSNIYIIASILNHNFFVIL